MQFDAARLAQVSLDVARAALEAAGPVEAVGISNQRASTIVWDRATGEPVGPGIGWQDLRTVGACLALRSEGLRLAPNLSATKLQWLLDTYDPGRDRDLCFGTVDTWLVWHLSEGRLHVTDATNALVTGLRAVTAATWDAQTLEVLKIPERMLPVVVDSSGVLGEGDRAPGRAADRRAARRPAGVARRAGMRAPRRREDHVRHGWDARPGARAG
ncbi:MAG: hypothetical protein KatS3mg010_1347 [Acidimicrobiia bacterium]|nr:MAG: hypothetical protein KatS3mg010_1347 [Acidimicrobiia bacterium]